MGRARWGSRKRARLWIGANLAVKPRAVRYHDRPCAQLRSDGSSTDASRPEATVTSGGPRLTRDVVLLARATLRGAAAMSFVGLLAKAMGLVVGILVARYLGPDGLGLFALLLGLSIIAEQIGAFGVPEVVLRAVSAKPASARANYIAGRRIVRFASGLTGRRVSRRRIRLSGRLRPCAGAAAHGRLCSAHGDRQPRSGRAAGARAGRVRRVDEPDSPPREPRVARRAAASRRWCRGRVHRSRRVPGRHHGCIRRTPCPARTARGASRAGALARERRAVRGVRGLTEISLRTPTFVVSSFLGLTRPGSTTRPIA